MTANHADVIVIGGGIVGCSTALFLSRSGASVRLLEASRVGDGASTAAAGILAPPKFVRPSTPLGEMNSFARLSRLGYDFYPEFLTILESYDVNDVPYRESGSWYLGFTEEDRTGLESYCREMDRHDRPVQWYEPGELRVEIPGINPSVTGGYFFEEEAHVDPVALLEALMEAGRLEGVDFQEGTRVESLTSRSGRVRSVQTTGDTFSSDRVVIAAGCWSPRLTRSLDRSLAVEPRKGEMIRTRWEAWSDRPMLRWGDWFLLPRADGRLDVGSTVKDTGFDQEPSCSGIRDLLESGETILPELSERPLESCWAGLRPYAKRKGGPFLGGLPGYENTYVAAGHYKTGILQGPVSGRLLARVIEGDTPEIDLGPYGVEPVGSD